MPINVYQNYSGSLYKILRYLFITKYNFKLLHLKLKLKLTNLRVKFKIFTFYNVYVYVPQYYLQNIT